MKLDDAYWYRYVSFDPLRVGSARMTKNTVFGMGADDAGSFYIWFTNSNERVEIDYDDVKALYESSRPYNGKIQGTPVRSGVSPKVILADSSYRKASNVGVDPKPSPIKPKDRTPTVEDDAARNANDDEAMSIKERIASCPYVYGMSLRPYGLGTVPQTPIVQDTLTREEAALIADADVAKGERAYRHGAVCYAEKLTKKMAYNFDMIPLNHKFDEDMEDEEDLPFTQEYYNQIVGETADRIAAMYREREGEFVTTHVSSVIDYVKRRQSILGAWMKEHPHLKHRKENPEDFQRMRSVLSLMDLSDLRTALLKRVDNENGDEPVIDDGFAEELAEYVAGEYEAAVRKENDGKFVESDVTDFMRDVEGSPDRRTLSIWLLEHPGHYDAKIRAKIKDTVNHMDLGLLRKALLKRVDKPDIVWEYQKTREGQMVNNPTANLLVSPHPVTFRPLKRAVQITKTCTAYPCEDQEIIAMMERIQDHIGNRVKMKLDYLEWGLAPMTAIVTYGNTARQVLLISPDQLKRLYGRLDFTVLGSAVTHEMGHYALNQIVKNSDVMKFKQKVAGMRLHSSQLTTSGSTYPFYHEQFAMLCEYGVWGTCIRGLQTTKGWDIVNKYFDLTQHITSDLVEQYP